MPSSPYAKLLVSLNGGAPTSGGIVTTLGVTVQLSGEDTAFWTSQRFEINDYPPGFPCPAGWSTDPNTLAYFYALSTTPPPFTIPALGSGGLWGKYMFWLTVNGGLLNGQLAVQLFDKSTGLSIYGPGGTHDLAFQETNQFNAITQWNADLKTDLRILDGLATSINTADVNPTPNKVVLRDATGQARATSFATASTLVADAGALRLQAGPQTAVAMLGVAAASVSLLGASDAHTLVLGDGNEITTVDFLGEEIIDVGALISFAAADTAPTITQAQLGGTGAAAGQTLTIKGQQGQTQAGVADNNNGATVVISGGDPGTGGSGAAGTQGTVQLIGAGAAATLGQTGWTRKPDVVLVTTDMTAQPWFSVTVPTGYTAIVVANLQVAAESGPGSGNVYQVRWIRALKNAAGTVAIGAGTYAPSTGIVWSYDETSGAVPGWPNGAVLISAPAISGGTATFSAQAGAAVTAKWSAWLDVELYPL